MTNGGKPHTVTIDTRRIISILVGVVLTLLGSMLGWLAKEFIATRDAVIRHELRIIILEEKDHPGPPEPEPTTDEEGRL